MIRNFDGRPLPPDVVKRIVDNGLRAPSAGFTQGTEFLVLEGPEQTSRYWDVCFPADRRGSFRWPGLFRAPLLVIPLAFRQAYLDRYAEPDKAPKAGTRSSAASSWSVPYWYVDAAFSSLLLLLTATDAGLGALFFRVSDSEALKNCFGVPPELDPIGAVAVGYGLSHDPSPSLERPRRPASEVVHRGRW